MIGQTHKQTERQTEITTLHICKRVNGGGERRSKYNYIPVYKGERK